MGSLSRQLARKQFQEEEKCKARELKTMYGKRPNQKCPKCGLMSLFFTNNDGEVFCVRCDQKITVKEVKK